MIDQNWHIWSETDMQQAIASGDRQSLDNARSWLSEHGMDLDHSRLVAHQVALVAGYQELAVRLAQEAKDTFVIARSCISHCDDHTMHATLRREFAACVNSLVSKGIRFPSMV